MKTEREITERCADCIYCCDLWWWTFKEDGHIDHKEYGKVCTVFADERYYYKMESTNDLCECFTARPSPKSIIRCKDCKHFCGEGDNGKCIRQSAWKPEYVTKYDYCSKAEREED